MKSYPVIASITEAEQITKALKSGVQRVNLMTGTINNLQQIIEQLHDAGKEVFVHIEMVGGIGRDASSIQYLADVFRVDGIVTTKSNAVTAAKQAGIKSIQRFFAIDSYAVETAARIVKTCDPDEVELMPGLMPRVIRDVKMKIKQPLIVGGLIRHEEEITQALENGADYVSIGDSRFW
ncbi:glycerol-3-phosphate responsive antiterminator [Paenibacillus sp. SI8]|uniref:glycerol-3-phosphate responsive antiterminator n=1 Tax=unclassified Paenibacillus TaxID=185978 RepID=UPI0034665003